MNWVLGGEASPNKYILAPCRSDCIVIVAVRIQLLERISSSIYIGGKGNSCVEQLIGGLDFSIYITANTL